MLSKVGGEARRVREDLGDLGRSGEGSEALTLDCARDTRAGPASMQDTWRPELPVGIRNEAPGRCGTHFTDELFLSMTGTAFWSTRTLSLDGQIVEATQWVGFLNCELNKEKS